MTDNFTWTAYYKNGDVLYQNIYKNGEIMQHRHFAEIKVSELKAFVISNSKQKFTLVWNDNMKKLIYYTDYFITSDLNGNVQNKGIARTCFGYENKFVKSINMVYENGQSIIETKIKSK